MSIITINTKELLANLTRPTLDPQDATLGRSLLWEGELGQTATANHFLDHTVQSLTAVGMTAEVDVSINEEEASIRIYPDGTEDITDHTVKISELPSYILERKEANSTTVEFLETFTSKTQEELKQELTEKVSDWNMKVCRDNLFKEMEVIVDFDFRSLEDKVKLLLMVSSTTDCPLNYCLVDMPSCVKA